MRSCAVTLALVVAGVSAARAQDVAGAEQFLRKVYADEARPVGTPNLAAIYDTELQALIQRDILHEVGLLRVDPICGCQDSEGLRLISIKVSPRGASAADAAASFSLGGHRTTAKFQLAETQAGWRIHDVDYGPSHSLRQYLMAGLAKEDAKNRP